MLLPSWGGVEISLMAGISARKTVVCERIDKQTYYRAT
jgi:hypothetical protein